MILQQVLIVSEKKTSSTYVSRGGLKLASIIESFGLDFRGKVILDVGSSTGGFTDFALRRSARKVIAVDLGSNQLHPKLRQNNSIELHEKTDIRNFSTDQAIDYILIDVSFISLRQILPSLLRFCSSHTQITALLKPQFEADDSMKNRGIIKNEKIRRTVLKDFELWAKQLFVIKNKADSAIKGDKGNQERFYLLRKI